MQLFHLYHHHHARQNYPLKHISDFWLFEISVWLHVIGRSLIAVFIPILLLTSGYPIGSVIIYYLIFNIFDTPLNFLADKLTRKLGARLVVTLGTLSAVAFFIALSFADPANSYFLVALAALAALYDSLYWVSHMYIFIESTRESDDSGKYTGIFYSIRYLGSLMGPAVGALILILFSQQALIVASVAILLVSIIPLTRIKKLHDKPQEKLVPLKQFLNTPNEKKNYFTMWLYGIHKANEGILWPLFIFLLFGTINSVVWVPIIISVSSIIFSMMAGHIRRQNRERMIILGSGVVAMIWILRLVLETPMFYYVSIFIVGLFSLLVDVPLDSNIAQRAKSMDSLSASTYRNLFSMSSRIILFGLLALLVNVFNVSFMFASLSLFIVLALNQIFISKSRVPISTIPAEAVPK
ncbi:MAG: MFS transporter [bacterium]|nr:MFS transporter [bacterium]